MQAQRLADELFEVFDAINRNLPGGNEAANFVHLRFEPAFVVPGDDSFHRDAFGDIGPIADIDTRTGGGELVQTVFGVEAIVRSHRVPHRSLAPWPTCAT